MLPNQTPTSVPLRVVPEIIRPPGEPNSVVDLKVLQEYVRANPNLLQSLLHQHPTVAEAILSDDTILLSGLIQQNYTRLVAARQRENAIYNQIAADPLNPANQQLLASAIQRENIADNMTSAIEHNPESFGTVIMLYIPIEINGAPLHAFVDSGAQQTIISDAMAEKCNLTRLIDIRYAGVAKGVGTAKILGRVHMARIKIGNSHFTTSLTVLQDQSIDFLLGLDFLKRFQCCIDLKQNALCVGEEKVTFLSEKDLPVRLKQHLPKDLSLSTDAMDVDEKKYKEEDIKTLLNLGCNRQQALRALQLAEGNVEVAASIVYQQMAKK